MENLRDFVKWIANQNVINIDEDEIDEVTNWLINDKNYQKLNDELIRRMKIIEKR